MIQTINDVYQRVRAQVSRVIMGQEKNIDMLFVALLSEGHVILEGVPGTGKTFLARVFSSCLALDVC